MAHGLTETDAADLATAALDLARRFAAGATMWCLAPEWPEHARHVAVEFVHPVILGKRALPAVVVEPGDPVGALRGLTRAGDLVLVVSTSDAPGVRPALQRARVWGLTTIWIGAGPRPPAGAADHVLWLADDLAAWAAPFDGRLVTRYHLLWELAHVCFEHSGLLVARDDECDDEVCVTCSDDGVLAEVVSDDAGATTVRSARGTEVVDTGLVGPVVPGDLVLVHAGTAVARVDDEPDRGRDG
jgi:hypothetical protein